jgi:hypothetical protein
VSLYDLLSHIDGQLTFKTVCELGIKLLDQLENDNNQGYVHNMFELQNIQIGTKLEDEEHQIEFTNFNNASEIGMRRTFLGAVPLLSEFSSANALERG